MNTTTHNARFILALIALFGCATTQRAVDILQPNLMQIPTEDSIVEYVNSPSRAMDELEETNRRCCCIIYVNANAPDGGDGSSWAKAFNDLQDALNLAADNGGTNEIWVAKGVYTPTKINTPYEIYADRPSFDIPNHTYLYGGFKGTECKRSQRNRCKYVSVLNGDILGNDLPISDRRGPDYPRYLPQAYTDSKADNARHVVTFRQVEATLDGFTISKGFAGQPVIGGANNNFNRGGGIWADAGSVILRNIIFDDCETYGWVPDPNQPDGKSTRGTGGAIFCFDTHWTLDKVIMRDGYANRFGPAFCFVAGDPSPASDCLITGLINERNDAEGCNCATFDYRFDLTKSIFRNNLSVKNGCGGLQVDNFIQATASSTVTECLFKDNNGGPCGVFDFFNEAGPAHAPVIFRNNAFLRNSANFQLEGNIICGAICDYSYNALIENCAFENNSGFTCGGVCIAQLDTQNSIDTYITFKDCCFKGNKQVGPDSLGGGAIHLIGNTPDDELTHADILTNAFIKNKSDNNGGAIVIENASAVINCNIFAANRAKGLGSAIYAKGASLNDVVNCNRFKKFNDNTVVTQRSSQNRKGAPKPQGKARPQVVRPERPERNG